MEYRKKKKEKKKIVSDFFIYIFYVRTYIHTCIHTSFYLCFFQNGFISALPYLVMWILSFPVCWLADYALKKGISAGIIRKFCNTIAHWGPAIALICLAAMSVQDHKVAVIILVIAVGLNAGSLCGFQINHIDLSPNFAGRMMSITNCIASVVAIIAPMVCGLIVTQKVWLLIELILFRY